MTSSNLATPLAHRSAAITVILLLAAACGDPEPIADDQPPATVPTTTTTMPADVGGFGAPAPSPGEFGALPGIVMSGTTHQTSDGCWYLRGGGTSALMIAPAGTTLGPDGTSLVTPDGSPLESGVDVDAYGGQVALEDLPGGPDGRWAQYVSFCGPRYPFAVVAEVLDEAFDPEAVDETALASELDASVFDTDYPCGFGFTTGDAEGHWRLEISPVDWTALSPGPVSLPDERLLARVTFGAHLFVNHCDDVAEWFEPRAVRVAHWPLVAGEFTYPDASPEICSGQPPQTIILTGATVDTPLGPVELDPIEITNDAFGCVAG